VGRRAAHLLLRRLDVKPRLELRALLAIDEAHAELLHPANICERRAPFV
jgi:hypothetical protein